MKTIIRFTAFGLMAVAVATAQDFRTATVVGIVTDSTGASVANANVTLTNAGTNVATKGKSNNEGSYYVPFQIPGNYRLEVEAPGFRRFHQTGFSLNAGETHRMNVELALGALSEQVTVMAEASLLNTNNAIVGGITNAKEIHDTPIPQSKPQHFLYYQMGAQANNDGSYHILGQPEQQMAYTIDGVTAKQALGKALGDTNTLITPPVDSLQEAQVFNQFSTNTPFEDHNFNSTLSGSIVIPKVDDGRNKTFFFLGYRLDYDHETNFATVSVPTQDELNGDFSFGGVGLPIYDPKSIVCGAADGCANGTGYTATAFTGKIIPTHHGGFADGPDGRDHSPHGGAVQSGQSLHAPRGFRVESEAEGGAARFVWRVHAGRGAAAWPG